MLPDPNSTLYFLPLVQAADLLPAHPTELSPTPVQNAGSSFVSELTPFMRTPCAVGGSHRSNTQKGSVLVSLTAPGAGQAHWNQLWALDSPQSTLQPMPSAGSLCSPIGDPQPALTLLSTLPPQQGDGHPAPAWPARHGSQDQSFSSCPPRPEPALQGAQGLRAAAP